LVEVNSEEDFFSKLGLDFISPELRENRGEIEAASKKSLPNLLMIDDLKGQLHVHSTYSDGIHSIEQIAAEAIRLGYSYIGITDHSRSAVYAKGLSIEELKQQGEEIDRLNEQFSNFRILKGVESDILQDGSLDYPDEVLSQLDYVIASVHSCFNQTEGEMTKRIIKAISNPHVKILGHPTGRLLLGRLGCQVNLEEVLQAARDMGKVMELNASPYRLDLDWRHCIRAKELDVKLVINSDAHRIETLSNVEFGVMIARKGWIEAKDTINSLEVKDIIKYLEL
ncbi:MAG: PHP domain-containing protein, partial [Bacillota bacterium]|nr:PHP domain-containing protein [Bacillota bacterium]